MLLILLLGKNWEYCQLLSGEHISSSHRFFPRSSSMGLEEKSNSQMRELGGPQEEAVLVEGTLSASAALAVSAAA